MIKVCEINYVLVVVTNLVTTLLVNCLNIVFLLKTFKLVRNAYYSKKLVEMKDYKVWIWSVKLNLYQNIRHKTIDNALFNGIIIEMCMFFTRFENYILLKAMMKRVVCLRKF